MNDFERKLRQQAFRQPPPDLRAAIFGAEAKVVTPELWTWRDWFWPSPQAWAALAAVWIVFAALSSGGDRAASPASPPEFAASPGPGTTLLTFHYHRDLADVLELTN